MVPSCHTGPSSSTLDLDCLPCSTHLTHTFSRISNWPLTCHSFSDLHPCPLPNTYPLPPGCHDFPFSSDSLHFLLPS